jgi:hypothetical protein
LRAADRLETKDVRRSECCGWFSPAARAGDFRFRRRSGGVVFLAGVGLAIWAGVATALPSDEGGA